MVEYLCVVTIVLLLFHILKRSCYCFELDFVCASGVFITSLNWISVYASGVFITSLNYYCAHILNRKCGCFEMVRQ